MSNTFDPYHKWLGIPPKDQPPNHYRLLGITLFEADREVIEAAANRQMSYLQELSSGAEQIDEAQKLLGEISRARVCLLNAEKKKEYDAQLREQLRAANEAFVAEEFSAETATFADGDGPTAEPPAVAEGIPALPGSGPDAETRGRPLIPLPDGMEAEPHTTAPPRGKKQKLVPLIVLAVVALVLVGGGLAFYLTGEAEKQEQQRLAQVAEEKEMQAEVKTKDQAAAKQKAKKEADRKAKEAAKQKAKQAAARQAKAAADKEAADKAAADKEAADKEAADKEAADKAKKEAKQKKTKERNAAIENLKTMGLVLEKNQWKRVDEPYKQFKIAMESFSNKYSEKSSKNLPMWRSLANLLILQALSKEHLQKEKETIATLCDKVPGVKPHTAAQDQMLPPWIKDKAINFLESKNLMENEKKEGWEISLTIKPSNKRRPRKQQMDPQKLIEHQVNLMLKEFLGLEKRYHQRAIDFGQADKIYYGFDINDPAGENRFMFLLENHPSPKINYHRALLGKHLKDKGQAVFLEAQEKARVLGSIPKTDEKQMQTQPDRIQKQKQRLYRNLNSNKEIQTALKLLGSKLINLDD